MHIKQKLDTESCFIPETQRSLFAQFKTGIFTLGEVESESSGFCTAIP